VSLGPDRKIRMHPLQTRSRAAEVQLKEGEAFKYDLS
jgi:hypothetical protein